MSEEKPDLSSGQREHLKDLLDGVDEQPEPDATADSTPGEADHSDFQIVPGDMVGPFKIISVIGRGLFARTSSDSAVDDDLMRALMHVSAAQLRRT